MIRVALIGLGKMGISHLAILNSHPEINLVAVCDSNPLIVSALQKYTRFKFYQDYSRLLKSEKLDAVVVAAPSKYHAKIVGDALNMGLHVFCEKPFCLDVAKGQQLAAEAVRRSLIGQVGYHFRFVGTFNESRRLVHSGYLGRVHHIRAEAYGPVVLRAHGATWRSNKVEGGGCLYDYTSHALDLINFVAGVPTSVGGTVTSSIFSRDVEDEVYSTLYFASGLTAEVAANWSDESYRKMSMRLTIWGTNGRISADRQELQLYLRGNNGPDRSNGWSVKNITELTVPTVYYLRGEEYSAQIDHFVECIKGNAECLSSFSSAVETDRVVDMLLADVRSRQTSSHPAASTQSSNWTERQGRLARAFGKFVRPSTHK